MASHIVSHMLAITCIYTRSGSPSIPCIHLVINTLSQFQLKYMEKHPPPNAIVNEVGVPVLYHRNNRVSVLAM